LAPRPTSARHRADGKASTPFDPVWASAQGLGRKTAAVVASTGLAAVGAGPALAADLPVADPSALTSQARAVLGAQSLASVPVVAAWTLDVPAITVAAPPEANESGENQDDGVPEAGENGDAADGAAEDESQDSAEEPKAPVESKADKAEKAEKEKAAKVKAAKAAKAKAEKAKADEDNSTKAEARLGQVGEAPKKASKAEAKKKKSESADEEVSGSEVIEVAARYIGSPYLYGGTTPDGFDCSGFTQYVYGQLGINLPHQSERQRHKGRVVSRAKAKPGDLIWVPGHVSIYAGGNKMIDSSRAGTTVQFRRMWQSNPTFIRLTD
jgi:cell wall-associated NlpC family hydrolase